MRRNSLKYVSFIGLSLFLAACSKDNNGTVVTPVSTKITIENVLEGKPLVQSGLFKNTGDSPVIMPGESLSFSFYAAKGQAVTFATMYGWSNDLFFAPDNPGISLYDADGKPIEGDVSSQIKLWDNGTRINQVPGPNIPHPGVEVGFKTMVKEVNEVDDQGNKYVSAKELLKATLHYDGNSKFTLTINNISENTTNKTPFSPGLWAVSYIEGDNILNPNILYESGKPTANGLTNLSEAGDNSVLGKYVTDQTGIFTAFSPVLVVVYNGISNPIYKIGEKDQGRGLKNIAQMGDATDLVKYLKALDGVKDVYVLSADITKVLRPIFGTQTGGKVSQDLKIVKGDRIAIATMYGLSNDWFFASKGDGVDATKVGNISETIALFDNGTGVNEYPGAGRTQAAFGGMSVVENEVISEVPNPNMFTTLPAISKIIKVTLE